MGECSGRHLGDERTTILRGIPANRPASKLKGPVRILDDISQHQIPDELVRVSKLLTATMVGC